MKKQRGFTLIEVLVAMAITAIAAVIAYAGLDSAIRLSASAEEEMDRLQKLSRALDVMGRDFRQIVPRKVRSESGYDFLQALTFQESASPLVEFSRNGWTNPQPERFQRSHLQRVAYHLDQEKLIRYSWPVMDRYADTKMQEAVVLEKVKKFSLRALVSNPQAANGVVNFSQTTWVDSWPPSTGNSNAPTSVLPVALEITIEMEGWGTIRRLVELVEVEP